MPIKLKGVGGRAAKNELPPPPQAFSDEAQEVLRAWSSMAACTCR